MLVRYLQQQQQQQGGAATFFFFNSGQGQVSSAQYILKAFIHQLREYIRRTGAESMLRSTIREDDKLTEPMSLDQFQRKLRGVFVSVDIHARVFFILDGLNNDEGVKKVIMHEILRVNRSRERSHLFRCVISSRFACEARISTQDLIQINLNTERGVQEDLLRFATTRLDNILKTSLKQTVPVMAVAKQLCSRADGSFLWLALALQDIQRMHPPVDLLRTVSLLPASIDAFYQRALQQIPSQDVGTAQKIFSWLTVASRLLYLPELLEALAVTADQPQIREHLPSARDTSRNTSCLWLACNHYQGRYR